MNIPKERKWYRNDEEGDSPLTVHGNVGTININHTRPNWVGYVAGGLALAALGIGAVAYDNSRDAAELSRLNLQKIEAADGRLETLLEELMGKFKAEGGVSASYTYDLPTGTYTNCGGDSCTNTATNKRESISSIYSNLITVPKVAAGSNTLYDPQNTWGEKRDTVRFLVMNSENYPGGETELKKLSGTLLDMARYLRE